MIQQLLIGKPGVLEVTLVDSNGEPTEAEGTLTVGVVSESGATIIEPGTGTTQPTGDKGGDVGVYQVAVTAAQTFQLDRWTATWSDAGTGGSQTSDHEVCGGFYFSLSEVRSYDRSLERLAKFSDTDLLVARQAVQDEAEWICDVCFVPRYRRVYLDGTAEPEIYLPDNMIRTIRSAQILADAGDTGELSVVTLNSVELEYPNMVIDGDLQIQRADGGIWDEGQRNVIIEYECGYDAPPQPLKQAALLRMRYMAARPISAIPDRASSFTTDGGNTYRLDSATPYATGIADVDAVYQRYSKRDIGTTEVPVSRTVNFDPEWYSVFHGGRR